jgi:hypothetical protein
MIFHEGLAIPASQLKLGKKPHRNDNRNLLLSKFLTPGILPMVPAVWNVWRKRVTKPWGMSLNDSIGDCAIVTPKNLIHQFTACHGTRGEVVVADEQVLKEYETISGYTPGKPDTDVGCDPLDVLKRWRNPGLFGEPPIEAFVTASPGNLGHFRAGHYLFGGGYLGLQLPLTAQKQTDEGKPWDVVATNTGDDQPGSWGGHAVMSHSYSSGPGVTEQYVCATWNQDQAMTPAFLEAYCDIVYFVLAPEWAAVSDVAANLFQHDQLLEELKLVA